MKRLRHAWPPGIRYQLLCWYTVIFAGVLLLSGGISYHYFEDALENSLDTSLQVQAQQIAEEMVPGSYTGVHIDYGALVRLLSSQGTILSETPACKSLVIPQQSVAQALQGHSWEGTIKTASGQEVQFYSLSVLVGGKVMAVVQVGELLSGFHILLHQLIFILFIVGGLALVICALNGYWLTGRAFAPIQRLTQTARSIKNGDLRQRVNIPPAHDEIRFLAITLNEMLDSLSQMVSRQRRFVADASHELRTPVAVIRNKTSIALLREQSVTDYATILQGIHTETERLGSLLHDLLVLSKGDEGRVKFEREPVHLDLLAIATVAQAEGLADDRAIHIAIQAEQSVIVMGDEARFIQILMNLLDNALRYTQPGGCVHVQIEVSPQNTARLIVSDTGQGIAEEHLPHIFERFYRADPAREQTAGSNSGLGLAIVEWLVRVHEGKIEVESVPEKGTSFTLTFPLAPTPIA